MEGDPVELGVELLARMQADELSMDEVIDRIETITSDPHLTREILRTADRRDVIDREDATVKSRRSARIDYSADIVQKEGEFTCRRCGTGLSTGFFIQFDAGDFGPFGSSCIRKVTGRD